MINLNNIDQENLIEILSFYKIDKRLNNFTTHSISISIPPDLRDALNIKIDYELLMIRAIRNELSKCLYNQIYDKLISATNRNYIDLTQYENKSYIDGSVFNFLNRSEYKNIISSAKISAEMQDSIEFDYGNRNGINPSSGYSLSSLPYLVGSIYNKFVWIDPYIKYDSDRIFLFNEINLNFEIRNKYEENLDTFSPKFSIEIDICIGDIDSSILSIISDTQSISYKEYLSIKRETKINDIIK